MKTKTANLLKVLALLLLSMTLSPCLSIAASITPEQESTKASSLSISVLMEDSGKSESGATSYAVFWLLGAGLIGFVVISRGRGI